MDAFNLNLTDKEHLRWGHTYADQRHPESFSFRRQAEDQFEFELGHLRMPPKSFAAELHYALTRLVDTHGTKLTLFYSGGSDSEVILRTLVSMGVRPEVHVIKFSDDLNAHETDHADTLCEALDLRPFIWHHDFTKFIQEQQYLELGVKWQCTQIAYLTVLKYAMNVDRTVIMGGEVYLQKHQVADGAVHSPSEWYYVYREDEDGVTYRYSNATGHKIINEVFTYTPALLYSYLVHPMVASVAANEVPGKITLLSIKRKVYEECLGYPLTAQVKYHGYEYLQWTNLMCRRAILAQIPRPQVARLEYNKLLQHLRGERAYSYPTHSCSVR